MREVVDRVAARAAERWGSAGHDRADVVWRHTPDDLSPFSRGEGPGSAVTGRRRSRIGARRRTARPPAGRRGSTEAGVTEGLDISSRKPEWMRAPLRLTDDVIAIRKTMRDLDLVTVCEEAGCPNLSECWADGTATFMINGERCTRACGFCLVDTRHPLPTDPMEPERVAEAVERMGLRFAVVTAVARDDLPDGGAAEFAAVIRADPRPHAGRVGRGADPRLQGRPRRARGRSSPSDPTSSNHNLETVARLQRAVRPSAGYARSLSVLARAKAAGLTTKSSLIAGLGETAAEMEEALADLAGVGVDIVTIGQYLRPTRTTSRSPAGGPPTSSPPSSTPARPWASPTSKPAPSSAAATTPARPPTPPAPPSPSPPPADS